MPRQQLARPQRGAHRGHWHIEASAVRLDSPSCEDVDVGLWRSPGMRTGRLAPDATPSVEAPATGGLAPADTPRHDRGAAARISA